MVTVSGSIWLALMQFETTYTYLRRRRWLKRAQGCSNPGLNMWAVLGQRLSA